PMETDIGGTSLLLERCALRVVAGGYVEVSGERIDAQGRSSVEVAQVARATLEDGFTRLTFAQPLAGTYKVDTIFLNGNVVAATNDETVTEVLCSDDASLVFQSFKLQDTALTWVSGATSDAIAGTTA